MIVDDLKIKDSLDIQLIPSKKQNTKQKKSEKRSKTND